MYKSSSAITLQAYEYVFTGTIFTAMEVIPAKFERSRQTKPSSKNRSSGVLRLIIIDMILQESRNRHLKAVLVLVSSKLPCCFENKAREVHGYFELPHTQIAFLVIEHSIPLKYRFVGCEPCKGSKITSRETCRPDDCSRHPANIQCCSPQVCMSLCLWPHSMEERKLWSE